MLERRNRFLKIDILVSNLPPLSLSKCLNLKGRERNGSVVDCLTRDREAAGSNLAGVTALCPCARHINPSLGLVQPRMARPYITERLLTGCKESNQTNQQKRHNYRFLKVDILESNLPPLSLSRCLTLMVNRKKIIKCKFCLSF